jgi:hypothetical protein
MQLLALCMLVCMLVGMLVCLCAAAVYRVRSTSLTRVLKTVQHLGLALMLPKLDIVKWMAGAVFSHAFPFPKLTRCLSGHDLPMKLLIEAEEKGQICRLMCMAAPKHVQAREQARKRSSTKRPCAEVSSTVKPSEPSPLKKQKVEPSAFTGIWSRMKSLGTGQVK